MLIAGALHHQLDTLQIRHRSSPVEDDVLGAGSRVELNDHLEILCSYT